MIHIEASWIYLAKKLKYQIIVFFLAILDSLSTWFGISLGAVESNQLINRLLEISPFTFYILHPILTIAVFNLWLKFLDFGFKKLKTPNNIRILANKILCFEGILIIGLTLLNNIHVIFFYLA